MSVATCLDCGTALPIQTGRGRPRKRCRTCSPPVTRRTPYASVDHPPRPCIVCGEMFKPHTVRHVLCSQLCQKRHHGFPCTICGTPMWHAVEKAERPTCRPCRRAARQSAAPRVDVWDCKGCGVRCERPTAKGQRPKWCEPCRELTRSGRHVPVATRRQVYERDNWTCGICHEPVEADLIGTTSIWRPSVDHVIPRSLGGDDDMTNLRLAHLWCNSVLNDGRSYTEQDFRVA